jgi:hypothetical protein
MAEEVVVQKTSLLPGKAAVMGAVSNRLRELASEADELIESGEADWDHLTRMQEHLSGLVHALDRGRQMFGWLDDVAGGGGLRRVAYKVPEDPS